MRSCAVALFLLAVAAPGCLRADVLVLDFEGFSDSTILTDQYPGLTFSNAIFLSAGISLNEFELPPRTGVNVVFDNNGPISISFASPILSFGGYFTYAEPVTLRAFDAANVQVYSATSLFASNDALFGDPGSNANEFINVMFVGGVSSVTITGDLAGGSFALDDATITTSSVPEPASILLLLSTLGFVAVAVGIRKRTPSLQRP